MNDAGRGGEKATPNPCRTSVTIPTRPRVARYANAKPMPPKLAATLSSASHSARRPVAMRLICQATGAPTSVQIMADNAEIDRLVVTALRVIRLPTVFTQTSRVSPLSLMRLWTINQVAGANSRKRIKRIRGRAGSQAASPPRKSRLRLTAGPIKGARAASRPATIGLVAGSARRMYRVMVRAYWFLTLFFHTSAIVAGSTFDQSLTALTLPYSASGCQFALASAVSFRVAGPERARRGPDFGERNRPSSLGPPTK